MNLLQSKQKKLLPAGIVIVILLLAGFYFTGLFGLLPYGHTSPGLIRAARNLNQYEIQAEFNPDAKTLTCHQKVEYTNQTDEQLTHLYFHLYPNAYRYENQPVFEKKEMKQAYPNGFSPGALDLDQVSVNGDKANFVVGGYSENILMLILEDNLPPGGKATIEMDYTVVLPNCLGRFGYGDNMFKAVNWYPIASVYDENGWNLDRYYAIGDPFYSEAANYRVRLQAPSDYIIAATGNIKSRKIKGDNQVWEFHAPAVRDFAWLAGNRFQTASKKVGKTTVTSYYYTQGAGEKALDYAAQSLDYFNQAFGQYPYPRFAVVESDFFIGGMEYPNLIMLDHSLYQREDDGYLGLVTVHETAHQWWYGLVGNNQIRDAWMDEGLTEYSTVLYYGHHYGREKEEEMYKSLMGQGKYNYLQWYAEAKTIDETIHRPSYEFADWIIYDLLVYGKGAMLFHSLREEMGDKIFFQALQTYFRENQFQNAGKEDLIQAFNRVTNQDWQDHFDEWLYGNE